MWVNKEREKISGGVLVGREWVGVGDINGPCKVGGSVNVT